MRQDQRMPTASATSKSRAPRAHAGETHARLATRQHHRAFTLMELLLVMSITGTLAAIAVPRYVGFMANQSVTAAANRIATDLAFARRNAKRTGTTQRVEFKITNHTYTLAGLDDPDHAGTDYTVRLADDPYRVNIATVNFAGTAAVTFNPYGTADNSGVIVIYNGAMRKGIVLDGFTGVAYVGDVKPDAGGNDGFIEVRQGGPAIDVPVAGTIVNPIGGPGGAQLIQ